MLIYKYPTVFNVPHKKMEEGIVLVPEVVLENQQNRPPA
jgi:hypothetical protein